MSRIYLVFVLSIGASCCYGQFANVVLETQDSSGLVREPSVAINPKNPSNIVVAAAIDKVYVTIDGGKAWFRHRVSSSMGVAGDPSLVVDGRGHFHLFHVSDPTKAKDGTASEKFARILVQSSVDGGVTWDDGAAIGLNQPKDHVKPRAFIDSRGEFSVTWTQFDKYRSTDENCQSYIRMSASRSAKKWDEPFEISQTPGDCRESDLTVMGGMPSVTFDGKKFVVWANQGRIFLDRSYDGTIWLSNDLAIAEQVGGWDQTIPGHSRASGLPTISSDRAKNSFYRGSLYVTWADQRNGEDDTDIWFIRSVNYGDNWTPPLRVNNDATGKRHQYAPWMTTDPVTGIIYILFYDRRDSNEFQTDVYLAYSLDGGKSFINTKLSDKSFTPSSSGYTNITVYKGNIAAVWTRNDEGKTSVVCSVFQQAQLEQLND